MIAPVEEIAAAIRPYFDQFGSTLIFPEGCPPIPEHLLRPAVEHRLVEYRMGSGWEITEMIVVTARGRNEMSLARPKIIDRLRILFKRS